MDPCAICFDNMCVPVFKESGNEIILEHDCSRLQCGHAFHTKCLIQSLHMTRGCPLCRIDIEQNDDREYARHRFHMLSYCSEILTKIKDEVLREHLKECTSFSNELETKRKIFKKRVSDFKKELRAEMNIEPILDHICDVKRQTKRIFHREINKRGGIFKTAIEKYNSSYVEDRLLFKERSPWFFNTKNKRDFW